METFQAVKTGDFAMLNPSKDETAAMDIILQAIWLCACVQVLAKHRKVVARHASPSSSVPHS